MLVCVRVVGVKRQPAAVLSLSVSTPSFLPGYFVPQTRDKPTMFSKDTSGHPSLPRRRPLRDGGLFCCPSSLPETNMQPVFFMYR